MKKILNLIKNNIKTKVELKRILKGNLIKQERILNKLLEISEEHKIVLEEIKNTNFKDIYFEEHKRYNDLEKENRKLRKKIKELEKMSDEKN